jgi:hypothetical protein
LRFLPPIQVLGSVANQLPAKFEVTRAEALSPPHPKRLSANTEVSGRGAFIHARRPMRLRLLLSGTGFLYHQSNYGRESFKDSDFKKGNILFT